MSRRPITIPMNNSQCDTRLEARLASLESDFDDCAEYPALKCRANIRSSPWGCKEKRGGGLRSVMNQQARMTKECPMLNDQEQRKVQAPKKQKSNSLFAPLRLGVSALKGVKALPCSCSSRLSSSVSICVNPWSNRLDPNEK